MFLTRGRHAFCFVEHEVSQVDRFERARGTLVGSGEVQQVIDKRVKTIELDPHRRRDSFELVGIGCDARRVNDCPSVRQRALELV